MQNLYLFFHLTLLFFYISSSHNPGLFISYFTPPSPQSSPPRGGEEDRDGPIHLLQPFAFLIEKWKEYQEIIRFFSLSPLGERVRVRGKLGTFSSIREVLKYVLNLSISAPTFTWPARVRIFVTGEIRLINLLRLQGLWPTCQSLQGLAPFVAVLKHQVKLPGTAWPSSEPGRR